MNINFETVCSAINTGISVDLLSKSLGYSIEVCKEEGGEYLTVRYDYEEDGAAYYTREQTFKSFRNGDSNAKCLETYCVGWVELVNAEDCEVFIC